MEDGECKSVLWCVFLVLLSEIVRLMTADDKVSYPSHDMRLATWSTRYYEMQGVIACTITMKKTFQFVSGNDLF